MSVTTKHHITSFLSFSLWYSYFLFCEFAYSVCFLQAELYIICSLNIVYFIYCNSSFLYVPHCVSLAHILFLQCDRHELFLPSGCYKHNGTT